MADKFDSVTVKLVDGTKEDFPIDLGESLQEAVERFGEDKVFNAYARMSKTDVRNGIASRSKAGVPTEELHEKFDNWNPGMKIESVRVSAEDRAAAEFANKSTEDQEAYIQRLIALAEEKKAQ